MQVLNRYIIYLLLIIFIIGCKECDQTGSFCSTTGICIEIDTNILHLQLDTLRSYYDTPFILRFVSGDNKSVVNMLIGKNNETTEEDYFYFRPLLQYDILEQLITRKDDYLFMRKASYKINGSEAASVGYFYEADLAVISTEIALTDSNFMNINFLFNSRKENFDKFWRVNAKFTYRLDGNKFKNNK